MNDPDGRLGTASARWRSVILVLSAMTLVWPILPATAQVPDPEGPGVTDPDGDVDHPVLYLLHGCCDDHRSWSDKTDVEEFTADMDVIVVMPA